MDLRYWAEKCQAQDKGDGITEFSAEKFTAAVKYDLIQWIRDNVGRTTREQRRELWDEVMDMVIGAGDDGDGYRKQIAAHDFTHRVNVRLTFRFVDFWDHTVTDYTDRFVWCCHALEWAIGKYDEARAVDAATPVGA